MVSVCTSNKKYFVKLLTKKVRYNVPRRTKNDTQLVLPTISTVLRFVLTTPITSGAKKKFFEIKNYFRTTEVRERLADLAVISTKNEIEQRKPEGLRNRIFCPGLRQS